MDEYTYGKYPSAVNLIDILSKPENKQYAKLAKKVLTKQLKELSHLMHIQDRTTRVDALTMWKQKFIKRVEPLNLPTIIKTHILSVATSRFRDLIIESKKPRQLTNGDVYNYYLNSESSRESKQRDIRAIIASQFIPNEQKHLIMWINERNNWDWIQKGEPNADNT